MGNRVFIIFVVGAIIHQIFFFYLVVGWVREKKRQLQKQTPVMSFTKNEMQQSPMDTDNTFEGGKVA